MIAWLCSLGIGKLLAVGGLTLDGIGVAILFKFQVDQNHALREDGAIMLMAGGADTSESKKWKSYRRLTRIGFVLLLTGFALQILGALWGDIY